MNQGADGGGEVKRELGRWSMDVTLICQITPPAEEMRQTVEEICGDGCSIADEGSRRVITIESGAESAEAAVESLQTTAERIIKRLSPYGCEIEQTSRLEDRWAPTEPVQGGSLAEGDRDRT